VIQGTTAQGTITENGQSGSIVIKTMGQSVRYEVSLPNEQFVTVFANGRAVRTQDGKSHPLPQWSATYYRPWHMPLLSRMADIVSTGIQYQFVGTETVSGRPAWHIQIWSTPTDGSSADLTKTISEFHVFVDQATAHPVKLITYDFSPDAMENRTPVETYFSDYRNISGALIPFHMTRYASGSLQADIVLSSAAAT
jgi:hypothetical protein